jgi:PIN domain nuclease of toxin-antitoxin system
MCAYLARLKYPPREWFDRILQRYQLTILPLTNEVMFLAGELQEHHKDPADRMIIASAMVNGLAVATADRNFPLYGISVIS